MCLSTARPDRRSAFVLPEVLIVSVIAIFVIAGSWSVYHMAWRWWHETAPVMEAERIARIALSSVLDGVVDPTAGTDGAYTRRNGVAWAVYEPDITASIGTNDRMNFGLEAEKLSYGDYPAPHNVRSFYMALDGSRGLRAVYYRDNSGTARQIRPTLGITDVRFEKFKDPNNRIIIRMTATVEKDVVGTRDAPYHIKVSYTDHAYLRNCR
jgi:hypothetical protein